MFKILQDRYYGLERRQKLYDAAKGKIKSQSANDISSCFCEQDLRKLMN